MSVKVEAAGFDCERIPNVCSKCPVLRISNPLGAIMLDEVYPDRETIESNIATLITSEFEKVGEIYTSQYQGIGKGITVKCKVFPKNWPCEKKGRT